MWSFLLRITPKRRPAPGTRLPPSGDTAPAPQRPHSRPRPGCQTDRRRLALCVGDAPAPGAHPAAVGWAAGGSRARQKSLAAAGLVGAHRLALRHADVAARLRLRWQRRHPTEGHNMRRCPAVPGLLHAQTCTQSMHNSAADTVGNSIEISEGGSVTPTGS